MNTRFRIVSVAITLGAAFVGAATAPAMAAETTCTTTPAQIRTLAATTANAESVRKAFILVKVGEKLCDEGARNEAGKKFSAAAKLLGTDLASLNSAPTAQ